MPLLIGLILGVVIVQAFIYFKQGRHGNRLRRYVVANRHEIEPIERWLMAGDGWLLYKLPDGRLLEITPHFVRAGYGCRCHGVDAPGVQSWIGLLQPPWSNYKRIRRMLTQP